MSNQFTQGPWTLQRNATEYPDIFTWTVLAPNPDAGKSGVCYAGKHFGVVTSDSEADARLIAAAPALYEALEQIADIAHKCANSGLKYPGKSESIRDHKDSEREIRDKARIALALVDSKNGETS